MSPIIIISCDNYVKLSDTDLSHSYRDLRVQGRYGVLYIYALGVDIVRFVFNMRQKFILVGRPMMVTYDDHSVDNADDDDDDDNDSE